MVLRAEIVSPEKRYIDREVDMVVVPGTEGDIAAMPERSPVMLQLRAGLVSLNQGGKIIERVFVSGGFADLAKDRCTILADSVRLLSELSLDDAHGRLQLLEADLAVLKDEQAANYKLLKRKVDSVRGEIKVIESLKAES